MIKSFKISCFWKIAVFLFGRLSEKKMFFFKTLTNWLYDTFCGCVLHYICENGLEDLSDEDLKQMLTFANAAASLVTTRKGALRVMPEEEEILELLKK